MIFAGFALLLENTKENDAFLALSRWALPLIILRSSAHRRCPCYASAPAAQHRTCAHAHHAHLRIVCAEYASVHNTRRRHIIRAHAHSLRICGTAHHLRSCTCAHTLRAHLLRTCAAPFAHAALGHAAFVHASIVIQGAAEAAACRGSPPPPLEGARRRGLLVGSGQGGECLICSTFYSVLGQGLGSDPPGLRPPPLRVEGENA